MIFEEMLKEERAAGRAEGLIQGKIDHGVERGRLFLQSFGAVSKELSEQIQKQENLETLKQWTQIAFQSKSLEEFTEKIR